MDVPNNQPQGLASGIDNLYQTWASNRANREGEWAKHAAMLNRTDIEKGRPGETEEWRSRRYIAIGRQKIMSGAGIIRDTILQDGKWPIVLIGSQPVPLDAQGNPDTNKNPAKAMNERVHDILRLCDGDRELFIATISLLTYGETYMRWYYWTHKESEWVKKDDGVGGIMWVKEDKENAIPGVSYLSPWDVFRDLDTEDIQESVGIICRKWVSAYDLRQMDENKDDELICKKGIKMALDKMAARQQEEATAAEGETQSSPMLAGISRHRSTELIEFWGRLPRKCVEDFAAYKENGEKEVSQQGNDDPQKSPGDEVEIHALMVMGIIVRFGLSEPKERPFFRAVCERVPDSPFGHGIGDSMADIQPAYNSTFRKIEDNTALTSNAMFATNPEAIRDTPSFYPGANIKVHPDVENVNKAIQQFKFVDVSGGLLQFMTLLTEFSDSESMVPKTAQGVPLPGKQANTATEINILTTNSTRYIGTVIHNLDEGIIEPVGDRIYDALMIDPDIPDEEKLPSHVTAEGSAGYQDRVMRLQKLTQFLGQSANIGAMAAEINWQGAVEMFARMADVPADKLLKTEEQRQAEAEAAASDQASMLEQLKLEAEIANTRAKTAATKAGIALDAENLRLDKAELADKIVKGNKTADIQPRTTPSAESPEQGNYIEKGMVSNNQQ